jgi:SDR family mycofactocin-dependent oxidoreductase
MTDFDGTVVLISGAGRGQGRSHALRFAQAGANIIAFDICAQIPEVGYPMSSVADLEETVRLVEDAGAKIEASVADVRSTADVRGVVERGVSRFGRLDVAVANAGILGRIGPIWEDSYDTFRTVLDVNVLGVWNVVSAAASVMIPQNTSASMVLTSSGGGIKGLPNVGSYTASKHAVIGIMRTAARELAPYGIRVNCVLPGTADTPMVQNSMMLRLHVPDKESPTREDFAERSSAGNPMKIPWVSAADVSDAVLWLASDSAKHVTGVALPVDGGTAIP